MVLSLVLGVLQGRAALVPFLDDGGTRTAPAPPLLLSLAPQGRDQTTTLRIGARTFRLWVVAKGTDRQLYLDRNGNDHRDRNEAVAWERRTGQMPDGSHVWGFDGTTDVVVGKGKARLGVRLLVSDTLDPNFAAVRNRLQVVQAYGLIGQARLGASSYRVAIRGGDPAHAAVFVDRDGDGVLGNVPMEVYAASRPFNLGGKSFRLAGFDPAGGATFAASPTRVAEVPMPPDLRVGKVVPTLASRTLAGKPLLFPKAFAGKLVLLDVWATWCGPCRGEIPYLKDAYAKYRSRGLEIVSMSIDDPGTQARVAAFTKQAGETWTQAFEGKGWASSVCRRYNITSIPFVLLVDGSTGRIVATEENLRGPALGPTVAAALARRR